MRKYLNRRQVSQLVLILLTALLINYVFAGSGSTDAARQAWPMIEQGALLIDVRTPQEFSQGHIDGAINVPWEETGALMSAIGSDKHRPVVVYCRSGNRSGKAKAVLEKQGYTDVFNATGYESLKQTKP